MLVVAEGSSSAGVTDDQIETTPQSWRYTMKRQLSSFARLPKPRLAVVSLAATAALMSVGVGAATASARGARATTGGTVLQTNLVSDLPGVAAVQDPNLVNAWGISESVGSPFWISDNNTGLSTLYNSSAASPLVSINPLVVHIPTPVNPLAGGT